MTTFTWKIQDEINLVHGFIHDAEKDLKAVIITQSIFILISSLYNSLLKHFDNYKCI